MNKETIRLDDLSIGYSIKKHHTKEVASHIQATIRSGELTCLLGENGVGKSTLLRTLSAFQPKLGGHIWLLGREVESYTDRQLSRIISVVLTERCEIRNMTVRDLVGMGRSPYTGFWGRLSPNDWEVVDRSIRLVGIEVLASRMVHTLSDGERQKVMIAKALAQETPIIFLDEPTAFLDYPSKVEIMQLLYRLIQTTEKTIFLSTHDLDLALEIADKIWLMERKQGITVGTPEDLALSGRLKSFFSGRGVVFDDDSGLYRIQMQYKYRIGIRGEGVRYLMLRKALQRCGIRVDNPASAVAPFIEVGADSFILHAEESVCYETIETLLQAVRELSLPEI